MIIDISPPLSSKTAVWPGDIPLRRDVLLDITQGSHLDLSALHSTVHIGAHADAPRHYRRDGATIDAVDLSAYIGPCMVLNCIGKDFIEARDCEPAIAAKATRVLFRTLSFPDPHHFQENFTAFAPPALELLGKHGVRLVGLDTPSVDPFSSKDLPAHQMLGRYRMANLEGLLLEHVQPGSYELIALPLKLVGFDASPVRAVLKMCPPT